MTQEREPKADQDLLAAFLESADETAFTEIVERHGPMVYRVCLRILRDHCGAEDAAQATFAVLARKAGSIRKRRSLASWLHGVARMTALYALRARVHCREREEETAMSYVAAEPVSDDDGRTRALEMLDEALARLSHRQREAIVLRHLQGRSIAEAATLAGCPPEVLTSRTRDGMEKLRMFYARRGVAVTGALLVSVFETEATTAVPQSVLPSILAVSASVAAGAAPGTAVSGPVLELTQGVLKMIMLKQAANLTVIAAAVLVALALAAGVARTNAQPAEEARKVAADPAAAGPEARARIGTYDSRAIAVAFVGSSAYAASDGKKLAEMMAELNKAKAEGNRRRVADLEARMKGQQALLRQQAFSTGPVDDILEHIKSQIPEIARAAGVALIVSKWDKAALEQHPAAERVDVTMAMVKALHPTERQLKAAIEVLKHEPIPLDQAERLDD